MKPSRHLALAAPILALCAALPAPAAAWGPIGHRVTAAIAERNIDGRTRAQVDMILGDEPLVEAATWPDEERSNLAPFWQRQSPPWHYVTLPTGRTIDMLEHPDEGDAATALEHFTAVLRDSTASREDKATALRFVVHLVGDMHMPLHVGKEGDRGGNWFNVMWFDNPVPTNLHWVWDEGMIQRQQLSFSEYADRLSRRMTPGQVVEWWNTDPASWMQESADLRDRIYPAVSEADGMGTRESPRRLSYQYNYDWTPAMEQRLEQAGVRIAAYLDRVFYGE